jgi:hypothetical protein
MFAAFVVNSLCTDRSISRISVNLSLNSDGRCSITEKRLKRAFRTSLKGNIWNPGWDTHSRGSPPGTTWWTRGGARKRGRATEETGNAGDAGKNKFGSE